MRPSIRLLNLEATSLQGPRSRTLYVCSSCRQEARPRPLVARQFLRNASSDEGPLTERMRRKIWGTENPPGLKDPYGGKGVLEKRFGRESSVVEEGEAEAQAQELGQGQGSVESQEQGQEGAPPAVDAKYVPATSWEGLQRVGHLGRWSDYPPSEGDVYNPFMPKKKVTKRGQLDLAAHQAAVELCLLYALKKPLASICDVVEHDKSVFKMIWKCKIQPSVNGQWDGVLVYPNKETESALIYIFEQIGGQSETAAAEAAGETEAEVENAAEEEFDPSEFEDPRMEYASEEGLPFFGYQGVRDRGFMSLALSDPAAKFAYLKRFSQLSGHYFPDPTLHSISTVKQAVDYIQKTMISPKPTKLADQLANKGSIQNRSNVKVFAKRQKPSDRDEELGSKKVIGEELRARGLIN